MQTPLVSLLAACLLTANAVVAQIPGLIAHWKLDGNVTDSSTLQNHGTLTGFTSSPWVAGKIGNAIAFNGTGYVQVTPRSALPVFDAKGSPYTVAFWVKGLPQNDKRIYSESNSQGNNAPLFTIGTGRVSMQTDNKLQIFMRNDANQNIINWTSNRTVFDGQWHHVAWVDNAGRAVLYIDGSPDTRSWDYRSLGPQSRAFGTFTTDTVGLGAVVRASLCCQFVGTVDDVRVYRFAMSAVDVVLVMNNSATQPSCRASLGKFGFGCGDGPLDIHAVGTPVLGKSMSVRIVKGPPNAPTVLLLGVGIAPIDLTPLGYTDCSLYVALPGLSSLGIGTLDASGTSIVLPLSVPNNTTLDCTKLALQGLALVGSPPRPEVSSALLIQFGR